jgi:hypothetical protein
MFERGDDCVHQAGLGLSLGLIFTLFFVSLLWADYENCELERHGTKQFFLYNYEDLQKMGHGDCPLDGEYELARDINITAEQIAAGKLLYPSLGNGLRSIGTSTEPFTGSFIGGGAP